MVGRLGMSSTKHANSTLPAATLKKLLGQLDHLARSVGLIQRRSRKFSAEGFLLTMLHAVCQGRASFGAMAMRLAEFESASLTRQSLHGRLQEKAVLFLEKVLTSLLIEREVSSVGEMSFLRVLIQDSTQFWMNRKNSRHYRGVSNNSGETAGGKLDLIMDLVSGQFIDCREVEACTQDRSLGPRLLDEVKEGDLVIRDLGYFDVAAFQRIEELGASWISRLHGTADVTVKGGQQIETLLESTGENVIDIEVRVTAKRHRVRLVAIRLPEEIANRRRQQKKDKRFKNKTSPRKRTLIREGWNLYLTNLTDIQCSPDELVRSYEQRWQIEIQFRALKQSTAMKRAMERITNRHHLQALLYAAMIFATLTVRVHRLIASALSEPLRLSMEKTSIWLSQSLTFLRDLASPIEYDLRHLLHDRRRRRTLRDLGVSVL